MAAPITLFGGFVLFFGIFTLASPYHLDTVIYLESVEQILQADEVVHPFSNRFLNAYLYLLPVALWGEAGVKWLTVLTAGLFLVGYYFLVRRNFASFLALPSALLLASAPVTVMTVTHLKEDYNALLLFTLSALVLGRRPTAARALPAGVLYGLSLLCKEFPLFLGPFLIAYIYLLQHNPRSFRELFDYRRAVGSLPALLTFLLGLAVVLFLLMPEYFSVIGSMTASPYNGQFLGPFSRIQGKGFNLWKEGILYLHPVSWLAVLALVRALRLRRFMTLLWFITFAAVFLVLSNTTVVRARVFGPALFFLLPLIVDGAVALFEGIPKLVEALRRRNGGGEGSPALGRILFRPLPGKTFDLPRTAVFILVAGLSLMQAAYVMPTLEYRLKYHPQKEFFGALGESLPPDALLLGMDNCRVATYYSGLQCLRHPVDPDEGQYRDFLKEVASRREGRRLFILPDFMAYDRDGVLRENLGKDFKLEEAYAGITEDFHRLTYGKDMDSVIDGFLGTYGDCGFAGREARKVPLAPELVLDFARYTFSCTDGDRSLRVIEYLNHETYLARHSVRELM
jgi:hypothetical protein